ncbi:DUF2911 domain-containing protein [Portibacter lacus]|uniref:DUF2911 domain-containing protein n=1 Tax=Portibacter lacus TaxID=1099794 RepID=A0AA37SLQ1_9BACT|nr:DUF2911 domain-containing protein [Portibacter lacus]GLR15844.1 hypothetical protein GCM10007940_04590 [Portibacter lacus]
MKYLFSLAFVAIFITFAQSQEREWPKLDASVLDVEYFPEEVAWRNYLPKEAQNIKPKVKVVYSRPLRKERKIFGELLKFGEEWRLGANEATMITFYQAVTFGETTVMQGTYSMSAIPNKDSWTLLLSTESGIWGNANRDQSLTIATAVAPVKTIDKTREALSMTFQEIDDKTANLVIEWENTRATLPIGFNPVIFGAVDPSPMDMAHYPSNSAFNNYAESVDKKADPIIQVYYSRPQKKGRNIFGELLKDGEMWRIGANEATEIVFYKDVQVGDKKLEKGRYAMFAKLNGATWDIIFSKDYPIWGEANRDETKDVASVSVSVSKEKEVIEALSIIFEEKSENSADMIIGWDMTSAAIPISWK